MPDGASGPERAAALAEWAERSLVVPAGHPLSGQPLRILPFVRDWLGEALDPETSESSLSTARKNGKTATVAALILGHLVGPLRRPGWRANACSLTGALSNELKQQIVAIAEASGLGIVERKAPYPGWIEAADFDARATFHNGEKATGHAVGSDLAIVDEAGQLGERKRPLWNSMRTSTTARDGKLLAISIRDTGPMFQEAIDRGEVQLHAAPVDCPLDDEAALIAANPAIEFDVKSIKKLRKLAASAAQTPGDEADFRRLELNAPIGVGSDPIISVPEMQRVMAREVGARRGRAVLGLDLGGSRAMTAAAALWPATGRLEVYAALPAVPGLADRGKADKVGPLYVVLHKQQELWTLGDLVTDIPGFFQRVAGELRGVEVVEVGSDRYRQGEAEQAIKDAGLRWRPVWRGTGASKTADGSADVRAFERLAIAGGLSLGRGARLLASAVKDSKVRKDLGGNPALDKVNHSARIDCLQAAVIAAGLAATLPPARPRRQRASALV